MERDPNPKYEKQEIGLSPERTREQEPKPETVVERANRIRAEHGDRPENKKELQEWLDVSGEILTDLYKLIDLVREVDVIDYELEERIQKVWSEMVSIRDSSPMFKK